MIACLVPSPLTLHTCVTTLALRYMHAYQTECADTHTTAVRVRPMHEGYVFNRDQYIHRPIYTQLSFKALLGVARELPRGFA